MKKLSNTEAELKKCVTYKKRISLAKNTFSFSRTLFEAKRNRTTLDMYDSISPWYDSTCIVLP